MLDLYLTAITFYVAEQRDAPADSSLFTLMFQYFFELITVLEYLYLDMVTKTNKCTQVCENIL
jgi:hypothetical protein